jgi:glutamate/tyrosine decarboxylase-like PLP-dependent enzyme
MKNLTFCDLELDSEERKNLQIAINQYVESFLEELPNQKAYVYNEYEKTKADEGFKVDGAPKSIENILELIKLRVDNTGLNPASGGHLGYIPGGGIYTAALGDYIAAATNRYAGVFYASPGAVRIENELINWVGNVIGYQKGFGGNISSGGSLANLIALSTAKRAKKIKSKEIENTVIYTTQQSHHSIKKALRLIGLDECILKLISLDSSYRMNVSELENQIQQDKKESLQPFLIVANAGSTDVGAVDDLSTIAKIAKKENLWLHVDAAYGGFFLLTHYGKEKLKGIEQADSITLDPHKSLFLPYGTGMVMVKNVQHLLETNSYEAGYMQDTEGWEQELSPAELSPELSRNFRGMRMWIPLQIHGIKPFEDTLNEKLALSNYFYESVQKLGFEVGTTPDLTVTIFRYIPTNKDVETFNRAILKNIQENGSVFISSTQIDGKFWLRATILSFRTHKKEVDILLRLLKESIQTKKA